LIAFGFQVCRRCQKRGPLLARYGDTSWMIVKANVNNERVNGDFDLERLVVVFHRTASF
jgi:hypothetical protein